MAKTFQSLKSPRRIALKSDELVRLRASVLDVQQARTAYQSQEMRLRADIMDAESAQAKVVDALSLVYGFDPGHHCELDLTTGALTVSPTKPKPS